jgi:hypothetical protein
LDGRHPIVSNAPSVDELALTMIERFVCFLNAFIKPLDSSTTRTDLLQEFEDHVLTCLPMLAGNHAATSNAATTAAAAPAATPFRKKKKRLSLGLKAARTGTPLHSGDSDSDDDGTEASVASIRPYVRGQFQSYHQGDVAEDVILETEPEAKELEVVETIEKDSQSAVGEEVPEIPTASQPIETPAVDQEASTETEIPDTTSEAVVVEEPVLLSTPSPAPSRAQSPGPTPTPSPSKQSLSRTNSGLMGNPKKSYFAKFTPIEDFEKYLQNPGDMSYEELYQRTADVAEILLSYQEEYDTIDQEIFEYETIVKAEARRAVEDAKEEADRILDLEDRARDVLQEKYHDQLLLGSKDWQAFLKSLSARRSTAPETLKHLNNLRNPAFMEAAKKRRSRTAPKSAKKLNDEPVPEYKLTKEEQDFEKRKMGRIMDPVKFDDMKQADAYAFEYSSHPTHTGNQPLDKIVRQPQKLQRKHGDSNGTSENAQGSASGRLRAQRTKTKRLYDVDDSATSEGEDEVPLKRARRPKVFNDGPTASPRASPQNVGIIPAAKRTFPSGKRVGRPPKAYSQSKLQAVQTAQELPDAAGEVKPALIANSGQLPEAGQPDITPVKRKHPGGRPKKVVASTEGAGVETPKPKNKGGRPRKNRPQDDTLTVSTVKEENDAAATTIQLGDADDVMQSTEVEDASPGNSPADSRPTTSSSSDTVSSFGGARRSARASTRTKTLNREHSLRSDDMPPHADNFVPSSGSSSKEKRKRGTADTEPSPIVVEAPVQYDEPAPKRRRTKAPKAELAGEYAGEMGSKRKRKSTAGHDDAVVIKKPKKTNIPSAEQGEDTNSELLSPLARKEMAAKKVQSEKSKKLSISTKARWASGGMAKAQETRRANLAIKKAAKEAAAAAAAAEAANAGSSSSNLVAIQPAPSTLSIVTSTPAAPVSAPAPIAPAPQHHEPILPKQQKPPKPTTPPTEGGRAPSTRVKRPTRIAAGLDGVVDDYDGDEDGDFPSEYDRYQALTSASSPGLGKRVRKSLVDLSAMMGETSDEDYY